MKKIIILFIAIGLLLSTAPMITGENAADKPNEKIKVIIGFNGKPDTALINTFGGETKKEISGINAVTATIPETAINALQNNPKVRYIEEDKYVQLVSEQPIPWGVDRIDAEKVWSSNTGSDIYIAIVDTGIDYDHPDLAANCIDGASFVDYTDDPMDDNGHGTHCAGIAAAVNNTIGVVGVAPDAKLIAAKVLDYNGGAYLSWIADGIVWAADNGADVISLSIGYNKPVKSWKDACDYAYYTKGVVVVAAAGNSGNPPGKGNNVEYPGRYDSTIAVAATTTDDQRAWFSSTGPAVELAAPGVSIYSTWWDDTYDYNSGTSMACPHVSGVAALVLAGAVDPTYDLDNDGIWDNNEVRQKMDDTAEDLGDSGRDNWYGYGLVDAEAAASTPPDKHDVATTAIDTPSSVFQGETATIDVTVKNLGTYDETFELTVTDETYGEFTETRSITLAAGGSTVETFTWDTTGATIGLHTIKAEAILASDEYPENNAMTTTIEVKEPGSEVIVTAIDPNTMQAGTTIDVTITGSGFIAGAGVSFENGAGPAPTASKVVVIDSNTITATITAKSGGPPRPRVWDVRVTNPDDSSGLLMDGFTITP